MPLMTYSLSHIADAMFTEAEPILRLTALKELARPESMQLNLNIARTMEMYLIQQANDVLLTAEDYHLIRVQSIAVASLLLRFNQHADSFLKGTYEEDFPEVVNRHKQVSPESENS